MPLGNVCRTPAARFFKVRTAHRTTIPNQKPGSPWPSEKWEAPQPRSDECTLAVVRRLDMMLVAMKAPLSCQGARYRNYHYDYVC